MTSFTMLIIIISLIIVQFIYESYWDYDKTFVYAVDCTRSEAGRPITEIIIDF
jgi:hypothetical protein